VIQFHNCLRRYRLLVRSLAIRLRGQGFSGSAGHSPPGVYDFGDPRVRRTEFGGASKVALRLANLSKIFPKCVAIG
jgi:hypothetical protein